jgi:hypothetical protein
MNVGCHAQTNTIVSRYIRASHLDKTYSFGSLEKIDFKRIDLIRSTAHLLNPSVDIHIRDTQVIVSQALVEEFTLFTSGYTRDHLTVLAKTVQAWHDAELVHGDLCLSNVGWHNQDVFVFDWEPLLVYRSPKGVILRTTPYCLHPVDRMNKSVSVLTDRYALIMLLLMRARSRHGSCIEMHKLRKNAADLSEDLTIPCPLLLQGMIANLEGAGALPLK